MRVTRQAPNHEEIEGWRAAEAVSVGLVECKAFFRNELAAEIVSIEDRSGLADRARAVVGDLAVGINQRYLRSVGSDCN